MAGPVIPQRYLEALGKDDPLEAMAEAPDRLRRLVAGLTEAQLAKRPAPGKWSIKEIVAHLADGEVVLGWRYRVVVAHDRPPIQGYDQDRFVEKLGVSRTTGQELLDDFAMARAVNLGLLSRLAESDFDRAGLHSERGEETVRSMVAMYAGHDRIHLAQVETIRVGLFPKRARKAAAPRARKAAARNVAKKPTRR